VTVAWIIGVALCLLAATYYVMELKRFRPRWLVILGQTALMLYFVHQLIVLTLVKQRLGLIFNHWGRYWAANAILMVVLVGLAYLWLYLKRAGRNWQAERRRVGAPRPA
jgi:peptidoglycan/LPS O-acetylase OafA/YrhL